MCASAVIGKQAGLRCQCLHGRGGSSPLSRTKKSRYMRDFLST